MKRLVGKNLVLIGMMGTGKTETGKLLASALRRRLVDTDELLCVRAGLTVTEIFHQHGETHFRRLEREVVQALARENGLVIATGGGVVLNPENVVLLRERGFLVWLQAEAEVLAERLQGDTSRPLLGGEKDLAALLAAREPLYLSAAHARVDTTGKTPLQAAEEIISLLAER
ncbi:MAG: shikimate kinase [Firmicutes bacterium]|nr:shikimate kinase [Bacillota bacterium]